MKKLPVLDGKKLIRILGKFGFNVIRIRGSHHFLAHSDGRATVVPVHSKETIGPGLFRKILKDCDLTTDEFNEFREKL